MRAKYYIKKPIPIRAMQYTGDNKEEIFNFTRGQVFFVDRNGRTDLVIHTLEGDMIAVPGYYIVMGLHDEPYPVRQDIFEETYEEVAHD